MNLTEKFENCCDPNDVESNVKFLAKFSESGINLEEEITAMLQRKEQLKERKEKEAEAEKKREAEAIEGGGKGRGRG